MHCEVVPRTLGLFNVRFGNNNIWLTLRPFQLGSNVLYLIIDEMTICENLEHDKSSDELVG